jgi:hypothetical protein
MKFYAVIILLCLLLAGTASAKQAVDIGSSAAIANAAVNPGIYTLASYTDCSDVSASVGTPTDMGDLDVDSTPDGASVSIDGSPWTYKHCIGGWPTPICIHSPIFTPYTGNLATGSHSITIALPGYKSYSGTLNICSQKVTSVHKTLATVTTTTPTTSVTTTATTTTATTTAAVTTTATTTVTTSAATTSAASTATTAIATSASIAATTAVVPATTSSVSGMAVPAGSGSLSMITTPAGAAVYIDGVQRGISPATIPGLSAGGHTVLLKLDGYQDLSTPVMITAGTVNEFSTGLIKLPVAGTAVPDITAAGAPVAATKTQSPGFEAAGAFFAIGSLFFLRKNLP